MKPRHEKFKPHLVKQYEAQYKRIYECVMRACIKYYIIPDLDKGSFYSTRFKKQS